MIRLIISNTRPGVFLAGVELSPLTKPLEGDMKNPQVSRSKTGDETSARKQTINNYINYG